MGLLLIGGVVVLVSVIGCAGANSQNRLLLLVYIGCLIVLVLGQLYVTLLLLLNRDKIDNMLNEVVDQVIVQYGNSSNRADTLMDNVQHSGKCCGETGPSDWLKNSYIQSLNLSSPDVLPCSCFTVYHGSFNSSWCSELLNYTEPLFGRGNNTFSQGCSEKLSDWLQENALTIVGMALSLILIQVLQFVITVYLYRAFGKKSALKRRNLLVEHTPNDDLDDGEENYAYMEPDGDYVDINNANLVGPNHSAYHPDDQNLRY
ncbi:leukocyte antigen CD37 isoform X2 [Stegastes partitus]|uniref:Leukocyte antigen CD37 isoform X2 n=2 Tax=Stegastes partitus TaxID=144197 RepID=A0A9Y4NA05_9TELE|nr:PREDICTED: leukocyte antigen CD37-like isoform X2 [Stegastes partitus]